MMVCQLEKLICDIDLKSTGITFVLYVRCYHSSGFHVSFQQSSPLRGCFVGSRHRLLLDHSIPQRWPHWPNQRSVGNCQQSSNSYWCLVRSLVECWFLEPFCFRESNEGKNFHCKYSPRCRLQLYSVNCFVYTAVPRLHVRYKKRERVPRLRILTNNTE